ncbi:DNA kinase/phosphatase Pnk1 [Aspergillus fumigatus]
MSGAAKRAASPTRAISPPPLKRKVESRVTKRTVASFFTPTSQKKPEKITWRVVNNSLVIGKYTTGPGEQPARREKAKVAAFDLLPATPFPGILQIGSGSLPMYRPNSRI